MTKQEFLETLGKILNRELSEKEAAENLHYYEQYIVQQMGSGKTEEEVLRELGDPRLIARTILQVDQKAYSQDSVYTEEADGSFRQDQTEKNRSGSVPVHNTSGVKSWLILILALILIVMLVSTVFRIALKLLPVILVAAVVLWIYREFIKK